MELGDLEKVLVTIDPFAIQKAVMVDDILNVLWELDQHLRSECKYSNNECACQMREKFYDILGDNGVVLDNLIR